MHGQNRLLFQSKEMSTFLKDETFLPRIAQTQKENEKPITQSLETIVQNASSDQPAVQLSAVQAARLTSR